jgi:hypothetical protein
MKMILERAAEKSGARRGSTRHQASATHIAAAVLDNAKLASVASVINCA